MSTEIKHLQYLTTASQWSYCSDSQKPFKVTYTSAHTHPDCIELCLNSVFEISNKILTLPADLFDFRSGPIMEITRTIIAVCLGLVVASQAQDCSKPVPGPNMNLKDSDIVLTTFPDGHKATFVCSLGYTTAGGSGVVTCTAGTWTKVTLHCKKKICGSPGQVDNGEIKYLSGNEFGAKLVVKCNLGFRLVGKRELTCGDQGWLGRLPVCEVVTCDPPAGIPNGLFSPVKDVYNYREVVQYSCTGDLILSGSKSVTCSEDGTFTPGPPQCTEVECADPKVANGEWVSGSHPPHKYLATVTYRCNAGYKMEGDATMVCSLNGQWMPGIPKCTGKPYPGSTAAGSSPTVGWVVGILVVSVIMLFQL
ncbi:membrane cofactor protein-like isoform X2 [Takifugu rubripes]|uniref:membrane cofactor protein-like isoform X2 n=1 Tax=Takifugu rubripes TaxID=31033 RepID=UPI001145FB0B|nr:membrane cofactor protein-like isoform X2 [Takifugu rubripes]